MDQFERSNLIIKDTSFHDKWVCVVGVGGVGAACVESLIRTGVHRLVLVDYDKVTVSNLNRQIQANHETVGMDKTTALKDKMLKINPKAEIVEIKQFVDVDNFKLLLEYPLDYVIDAIDSIQAKANLIKFCVDQGLPIISSCGMGNRIDPTQIKISRLDKTFNDPLAKSLRIQCRSKQCDKIKVVFSKELPQKRPKPIASLSFVVNVAGHILASEVIKDLGAYNET
ncbi:MAG TPA: tRNA threonylcarbamoyladenosine dehydratase [Erysipelothrix sp.]|nr:tRNA threonylcarbamoyladenosine dehydratase [Erysipelothrix sp.]